MTETLRSLVDPRLRVFYLGAAAAVTFLAAGVASAAALAAAQAVLWLAVGLPLRKLLRQLGKLSGFALFLIVSYALTADDPATDRWQDVSLLGMHLSLNLAGAATGLVMSLRILSVVLASQVARAGDARAIAAGFRSLGMPRIAAVSIDAVLALLGEAERGGRGRGTGGGGGGGGGRRRSEEPGAEAADGGGFAQFWAGLKRLGRGDVGPLVGRLERQIARAEDHAAGQGLGNEQGALVRDIGVIAGVTLTMLGVKALKILPSIPFAPGHKLVILTPLYVVAALLTRSRLGATVTGLTMGTAAFLMGDGRYGVFEILKHVTPGVICDLGLPLILVANPGPILWSLFGGVIAAGRFATILAIIFLVQAPAMAYAIVLPGLIVHVTFGTLSGYVTHHLVRGVDRLRAGAAGSGPAPRAPETTHKEIA